MRKDEIIELFNRMSPGAERKDKMLSRILDGRDRNIVRNKVKKRISMAAVFASALLIVSVAALAAATGGFDWLVRRFNPAFGDIAVKVEAVCVDSDIEMEIMGAQKYGDMAVVYMSLQDLSGENRITERTSFKDGLSVKMNTPAGGNSGMEWSDETLFFDEKTNTAYYEITLRTDWPMTEALELSSFLVYFDTVDYKNVPIDIDWADITAAAAVPAEAVPVADNQIVSWTSRDAKGDDKILKFLTPGHYMDMPHGVDTQRISNVGIIDGALHVQVIGEYGEFGANDPSFSLMSATGEEVRGYDAKLFADKDGDFLSVDEYCEDNVAYKYEETVFYIDPSQLSNYSLLYSGSVSAGAEGAWKVAADIGDSGSQTRIWTNTVSVDGRLPEQILLSPLGVSARGVSSERFDLDLEMIAETADGSINLGTSRNDWSSEDQVFRYFWRTETPLDVSAVKALKINGVYIDIE